MEATGQQLRASDSGPDFETRAIDLARTLHDPSGTSGAEMVDGRERDGLFIDANAIFAYEFTILRTKEKAQKDAKKLADLLLLLKSKPEHAHKPMQGRFVTAEEPTAEQRGAVKGIARDMGVDLVAMSFLTLRKTLIDSESYIRVRSSAPFGSAGKSQNEIRETKFIEPKFSDRETSREVTYPDLAMMGENSRRIVITGDFGIGKSATLADLFWRLRKQYFKSPQDSRFPVHINLRDLRGLRTAAEVLRRHAEEIGFGEERSLISAWRAGACDLLLDGFDELVPLGYSGGVKELDAVRRAALEPVRRLIQESPDGIAIVVAGRTQYFSDVGEIRNCLGDPAFQVLDIRDFDIAQAQEMLGVDAISLPDWMPTRPYLLKLWLGDKASTCKSVHQAESWRDFLRAIALRESDLIGGVLTQESVLDLLAGMAAKCRVTANGQLSSEDMQQVYRDVFRRHPDPEGIELLMRLPGLVPVDGRTDMRGFGDADVEAAAYGLSLATYIKAPQSHHALSDEGMGVSATAGLAGEVAAAELLAGGVAPNQCVAAMKARMQSSSLDGALLEIARCADGMGASGSLGQLYIHGTLIAYHEATGEGYAGSAQFDGCLFEELDLQGLNSESKTLPRFQDCLVQNVLGVTGWPTCLEGRVNGTEASNFTSAAQTTDGILALKLDLEERIALTILRKVFVQKGSGRKLTALYRGVPGHYGDAVSRALERLKAMGFVQVSTSRREEIVLPVRTKAAAVNEILAQSVRGIPGY